MYYCYWTGKLELGSALAVLSISLRKGTLMPCLAGDAMSFAFCFLPEFWSTCETKHRRWSKIIQSVFRIERTKNVASRLVGGTRYELLSETFQKFHQCKWASLKLNEPFWQETHYTFVFEVKACSCSLHSRSFRRQTIYSAWLFVTSNSKWYYNNSFQESGTPGRHQWLQSWMPEKLPFSDGLPNTDGWPSIR